MAGNAPGYEGLMTVEEGTISFLKNKDDLVGRAVGTIGGVRGCFFMNDSSRNGLVRLKPISLPHLVNAEYTIHIVYATFYTRDEKSDYYQQHGDARRFRLSAYSSVEDQLPTRLHLVNSECMEIGVYVRVMKPRVTAGDLYTRPETPHSIVFNVEGVKFYADKTHLMAISPFFTALLSDQSKFLESEQGEITLRQTDPAAFNDFLHAIARVDRVLPNPTNVLTLTELADRYDVAQLREDCGRHLRHCPEIPLATRLQVAKMHRLDEALQCMCVEATPSILRQAFLES